MGVKRGWRSREDFPGHKRAEMCAKGYVDHLPAQTRGDTANPSMLGFHTQVRERKHLKFKDKWAVGE